MATTDIVLLVDKVVPPQATAATADAITGASTPAETFPVWDFDADAIEYLDFMGVMGEAYDGGGLTVELGYSMSSATADQVIWSAAIRRIVSDDEDLDTTAHTYDYNDAVANTVPSAVGEVKYVPITFTNGADMDSLAKGERFVLRIRRVATGGDDDATGDAELHGVTGRET